MGFTDRGWCWLVVSDWGRPKSLCVPSFQLESWVGNKQFKLLNQSCHMNCKNKTNKHSLTLRVGFPDREWCWLVVSGKGMASFPLWAFHGRVRRQDHDPSLTQSNQSNRKKCYPLLFSLLSWCDNKTERMAQVYCFKSSLQHLKKQGVWIEGWKRTMFRERKRMFFSK